MHVLTVTLQEQCMLQKQSFIQSSVIRTNVLDGF